MNSLGKEYKAIIENIQEAEWADLLLLFADANLYQTWSYGKIRWNEKNLSHLILKKDQKVVAMAQLRIVRAPLINRGIAYVPWGPLWKRKGEPVNYEYLQQILIALSLEYVVKRKYLLRIQSSCSEELEFNALKMFSKAGFRWKNKSKTKKTILVDLEPSISEIRKSFARKWRNHLNRAERNNLEIEKGTSDKLFEKFLILFEEMLFRKKFVPGSNVYEFQKIQSDLPDNLKMMICICKENNEPVSGVVCTSPNLGNKGIYLLGAINDKGLKSKGAYILQWEMIKYYKESGCKWYDLGGINKIVNPGVYHFKIRISSNIVRYLRIFERCRSFLSYFFVKTAELLRIKK